MLLMLAIALTAPLSAYAQESSITPSANVVTVNGSSSGVSTTDPDDGTVAAGVVLAVASTLIGIAFVSIIFVLHRREQER